LIDGKVISKLDMRIRIWLASATVIALILLLALTVNHAREKDMVEIFSRQQLSHAQIIAARMSDVFLQAGKNIALLSYLEPLAKTSSSEIDRNFKILYSGWEKAINAVVLFDAEGRQIRRLPRNTYPSLDFVGHFHALKKKPKQYFSLAAPVEKSQISDMRQKTDWYLIFGYPIWQQKNLFSGAWIFSFSLADLMERYEKRLRDNKLGDLWLTDEVGKIIIHPDAAFIGKNIKDLIKRSNGPEIGFSSDFGGYLDSPVLQGDNKKQRSIIAYYPWSVGEKRLMILIAAPYSHVVSPVRKTFTYTLFSAFLLVLVVVVASITFAYREGKRLRSSEEQKRLQEREDWQEKLLREKKTIDGIIEGSPIPTFVINNEHKVILWNRACIELTGYTAGEMLGTENHYKPFYSVQRPVIADLIIKRDIEGLSKYYGSKKVKQSDKVLGAYEATDHFENLNGRSRELYFLASPIYDEKGDIIAAIETLQDISREEELARSLREYAETLQNELTENIELRRELEELYNYMQSIVNSLPDKIYELDENGIINYMSRGLKKGGGRSSREFKGKHFLEFVAPGYEEFVLSKWEDAKKGIYDPYEIETTTRDGRRFNLLISTSPIVGTGHYILVQRDITEFKNLEKKLYDSRKLAALGQLSAGIAHEVRNPLSSIKMSLQILEKRINPVGNDLKRFKIAEKEVEHLEELVNNVLVFAKPVEPKMAPVEIAKVIEQVLALAEKEIVDKRIDVQIESEDVPMVTVDASMITDAFLNIIRNAADAVEMQGVIRISVHNIREEYPALLVSIEDNGCGIDEEDMPHLYNPFFTRKKYGTGLGLSQVMKIIELHHGSIDIASEKGKGTKVNIILPCSERRRIPREKKVVEKKSALKSV
jgi:PAS domain S-box-containing protein